MESVRSAFHAQLATVMDTLLAAAVCEIAKIFESSLCEHQAELLQKTKEISILRGELQKVEQRHRTKGTRSDVDEKPTSEREDCGNQDTVNASDKVQTQNQNFSGFKEESDGLEGAAAVKHEQTGSPSNQESVGVQASEPHLEKGQTEPLSSAQCKDKLSHWNHSRHTAAQLHEDDAPTPLLSLKVRSDTSRTEGWFPGLSTTEEPTMENIQINGSNCGPMNGRTVRDSVFGFDESGHEDDSTFPFLHQEPENQGSSPNMVESQEMEQRGARGPINHTRRGSAFSSRDPLRPQSNLHTLALRNMNSLSNPPAATGGNGRPYTCPYCTKCFTYPSHQRRHLLRHTGVRLHRCQFCEKSFLTPSELTVHTRTHTGERPFGCAQCGKRFARSGNLRAHQRDVHLGKRPFACTECGKRFAHRGNLRVHNHRVHQGDPYFLHESHIDPDTV